MALTIAQAGTGKSTASSATVTATVTASVGDTLIVMVGADNAGTSGASSISSVTDSAGNTYTKSTITNRTAGSVAADGATLGIFYATLVTALSAGTVTVNLSPNTTSKGVLVWKVTASAGKHVDVVGDGGAGTTGNMNPATEVTGSITNGDTVFCAAAIEYNGTPSADSDTTNGNWSSQYQALANTGTAATSMQVVSQYKTVTATATQSYAAGTLGSTRDCALNYITLREVPNTSLMWKPNYQFQHMLLR